MEHIIDAIKHGHGHDHYHESSQHYAILFKANKLDWREKVGYWYIT
jgi:hypothetical protein